MPHANQPMKLLDASQYLSDLTVRVQKAQSRIAIMSLILTDDSTTHKLITALETAAKRGVSISIAVDAFTYSELGGYFSPFKHVKAKSRAATRMAERLQRAGVQYVWLGRGYKFNPFRGLTHLKWAVVDSTVYAFGGVNLYNDGIKCADYMFKIPDAQLAHQIFAQHQAIIENDSPPHSYPGLIAKTNYGTVFIDSGQPRKSIIYERITELAREATHVLVVTQYCPSGAFARRIKGKSDVYFNQAINMPFPSNALISFSENFTGLHSQYQHKKYLHAKFIIFTMPSGKKIAITGSHNFAYSGVIFGTREAVLETDNTQVINHLEWFFATAVK
jgi:cardiolipin synthase